MTHRPMGWAFLCLVLIAADQPPKGDQKGDLSKLQGTWEIVAMEAEGQKLPEDEYRDVKWVFEGNKIIAVRKGERKEQGSFTLDEGKQPRWIDTTAKDDGDVLHGIYQLDGDDLKICLSKKRGDRPKEFTSKPDREHGLLVLKRQKQ